MSAERLRGAHRASCRACALVSAVLCSPRWWPRAGDAPCAAGGAGVGGRGQIPAVAPRRSLRAALSGVRQQGWEYKPGNQVKPLHGCRSSAHPFLSCSLECATWEALADSGIHLIIFFTY